MGLYRDSLTGDEYEIPDGTDPASAQVIVQRQKFARAAQGAGGMVSALAGALGDAQNSAPVQPTIAGVNGGQVVGLGLQGTQQVLRDVQASNSDMLRAKEERRAQVVASIEKEKERQQELKMHQEALRTRVAERKLMEDTAKAEAEEKTKQAQIEADADAAKPDVISTSAGVFDKKTMKLVPGTEKEAAPILRSIPGVGIGEYKDGGMSIIPGTEPQQIPDLDRPFNRINELDGKMHQWQYEKVTDPNDPGAVSYIPRDYGPLPEKASAAAKPSAAVVSKFTQDLVAKGMPWDKAYATAKASLDSATPEDLQKFEAQVADQSVNTLAKLAVDAAKTDKPGDSFVKMARQHAYSDSDIQAFINAHSFDNNGPWYKGGFGNGTQVNVEDVPGMPIQPSAPANMPQMTVPVPAGENTAPVQAGKEWTRGPNGGIWMRMPDGRFEEILE